jgi:hypothetical protein
MTPPEERPLEELPAQTEPKRLTAEFMEHLIRSTEALLESERWRYLQLRKRLAEAGPEAASAEAAPVGEEVFCATASGIFGGRSSSANTRRVW